MRSFWQNKRILITGASGFLGSHLTARLLREDAYIFGLIKKDPGVTYLKLVLKETKCKKAKILKSDILDFNSLLKIFRKYKPDICLHLAAQPIVGIANKSPLFTFETNIRGTWNILETARVCNTKAVVVASTDRAYGGQRMLPFKEEAALQPLHPYDVSKACADMLTRCYAHTYGVNTSVTRCVNIYGPGDFNFSRIIPDTVRSAIENKNPVIRSDGTPLRDYVFIDDAVRAYLILARKLYLRKVTSGEAFNFGTGKPVSVLSLVHKILRVAKKYNLRPQVLGKKKIKGEIDRQYLSSLKANKMLGWKCRYTLEKGLKITFAWYSHYLKC